MERDWKDRTVGGAELVLDVAKGVAEAFVPLKAVLQTVSVVYNQYKVCSLPSVENLFLKSPSPRKLPLSKIRPRFFFHASPHWRRFSTRPLAMWTRKGVGKRY